MENEKTELKSLKEKNKLIKERQEAQEGLEKFIKKIKKCFELNEKHLLLLCQTAKPISDVSNFSFLMLNRIYLIRM